MARLDTMVTVVDAANLLNDYASSDFLKDRGEYLGEEDNRTLVDQIEFADVIVLNKVSTAAPADLKAARKIIRVLNPDARIVKADFGKVGLSDVLDTSLFDIERAHEHPLWFKESNGFTDHVPETEEYGIRSFVYRARRPFAPARFKGFTERAWPGLVRAKGFFWLATRPGHVGELSQAGALVRTGKCGLWWSAVPRELWPDHPGWRAAMKPYLDPIWGDRRQEIVFIGTYPMNEVRLRAELDACLIDTTAFNPERWQNLTDPFPNWVREA